MSVSPRRSGARRIAGALAIVLGLAAIGPRAVAQQSADPAPNFDVRLAKGASRSYLERFATAASALDAGTAATRRIAAAARLGRTGVDLEIVASAALGAPEVVGVATGSRFLAPPAVDRAASLEQFVAEYADLYGLAAAGEQLVLVADYVNPAGNMAWVELEQRLNGLPVFQGRIRGGFTARGELARTTGPLAPGLAAASLPTTPTLSAAEAIAQSAATVGWRVDAATLVEQSRDADGARVTFERGALAGEPRARLLYFPLAHGLARLAWMTEIWGDPHVYIVVVDAEDGTLLFRKNATSFQTQAATYVVYDADSPAPLSPTTATPGSNTQPPFITRTPRTLIGNEAPFTFNNLGWMTDNTNGVHGRTEGNNARAGMDRVAPDGIDQTVPGVNRVFDFAYDPSSQSPLTAAYQAGEATQMFYWTNVFHDRAYLLGFTEGAGNFQNNNFGRGGQGNDAIDAEGQDYSGQANANFTTLPDGSRGRMQMYIFPGPTPDRSSGLDQELMLHELAHGLSSRLHADALGLATNMAAAMGEGWSDFYARTLLSSADEDVNGVYASGAWAPLQITAGYTDNYYYGIRRFPRAVRTTLGSNGKPHDPLTFADIDATKMNLSDGAYNPNPIFSAAPGTADDIHNAGEIWAGALLEVRARFITRLGYVTGNQRILQFVTDAMKLDPPSPTMLQGRDSLLAAANAGGGTRADIDDIWAGFAARGMGVFAAITNPGLDGAGTTRVTENFNRPTDPGLPRFSIDNVNATEGNAGTKTMTFTVTLADGGSGEKRVSYRTVDGTASSATFTSSGAITVPAAGTGQSGGGGAPAGPYPKTLAVSGVTGSVTSMAVALNGVSHTFPEDMDLLLVGPTGTRVMLMSDAGSGNALNAVDLLLVDGAPAMTSGQITSGTYAPTDLGDASSGVGEPLAAPAPAPPYSPNLAAFNGLNPNGTWSLYVVDDFELDTGSIQGFSLIFTTSSNDYGAAGGQLVFPTGTTTRQINVTIFGDTAPEGDETFFVDLVSPVNALLSDGRGKGIILNDDGGGAVPAAVNDSYDVAYNTALVVPPDGVLDNDDSNGGGLLSAALVSGVSSGTLSLAANGGFTYTPNAGFSGNDAFTYRADNAIGQGSVATVTLIVGPATPPPTSVDDSYSTAFETVLAVAAPGVLANDNPNGGGAMSADLVADVSHGTLALGAAGGFTYTPAAGYIGPDTFTYRASNSAGPGNVATVTLTINAPAAPTAVNDGYTTPFGTTLLVAAPGVLTNDNTNGGGPMTAAVSATPVNGTVSLGANGSFSYTPAATFAGIDSFRYRAVNGIGPSAEATVTINVSPPTTVQPPIGLQVSSIVGNRVTLRWTPAAQGPPPTEHVVEGGVAPGQSIGVLGTSSPHPIFTFDAPTGAFYVRVHALRPGERSGASNEIPIYVNVPQPPSAPAGLVGVVNGSAVGLAWRNTFAGGAPASLVLDVTGAATVSIPLAGSADRFDYAGVPPGTYTFTVRAVNGGGASPSSNAVTLTFPGACTAPQPPSGFLAYRIGNVLHAIWNPPVSGSAPASYMLNVSGPISGSVPTTERALSGRVDMGIYSLSVTSINACGSATTAPQTVIVP